MTTYTLADGSLGHLAFDEETGGTVLIVDTPAMAPAEDLSVGDVVDLEDFGPLTGRWEIFHVDHTSCRDGIARVAFDAQGLPDSAGTARIVLPADAMVTVVRNTTVGWLAAHGLEFRYDGEPSEEAF